MMPAKEMIVITPGSAALALCNTAPFILVRKSRGVKTYQGRRCKHGHSGLRYTSPSGSCVACKSSAKQWRASPEGKAYAKAYDKVYKQRPTEKEKNRLRATARRATPAWQVY